MQTVFDWGAPRPAEWAGPKERMVVRVPADLAADLRRLAARSGVSLSTLVSRLLADAAEDPDEVVVSAAVWPSAVDGLIG